MCENGYQILSACNCVCLSVSRLPCPLAWTGLQFQHSPHFHVYGENLNGKKVSWNCYQTYNSHARKSNFTPCSQLAPLRYIVIHVLLIIAFIPCKSKILNMDLKCYNQMFILGEMFLKKLRWVNKKHANIFITHLIITIPVLFYFRLTQRKI